MCSVLPSNTFYASFYGNSPTSLPLTLSLGINTDFGGE